MKTKNGLVTLQVPEDDLKDIFNAINYKVQEMEVSPNDTTKRKAIELNHLRNQLRNQATAQGWKPL